VRERALGRGFMCNTCIKSCVITDHMKECAGFVARAIIAPVEPLIEL
jgi:hypothetical protein